MHDRRFATDSARLHIGAGTDYDACHRQCTKHAAQGVTYALREQFTIVLGARTLMHLVYGGHGQQRFGTGYEGQRDHGQQHAAIERIFDVLPRRNAEVEQHADMRRFFEHLRQEFYVEIQPVGDEDGQQYPDQRSGNQPKLARREARPQYDGTNRQ